MTQDITLEALRKQVERSRRDIEEKQRVLAEYEKALSLLEAFSRRTEGFQQDIILPPFVPSPAQTFTEQIRSTIRECFADQREFTVVEVQDVMRSKGMEVSSKEPRKKIAMALAELEAENEVERTFRGAGSVPHRFKVIERVSA